MSYEVNATEPTDVNNDALVHSTTHDPNLSNNQDQESISFTNGVVDLTISKLCKPD